MSEKDYAPLSIACVRGLCDKIYEKRKFAGAEIEKMVKDFSDANNTNQIKKLIRVLGQDLMASTNPNVKNGALMGLSSVAVGLGKGCTNFLPDLIHPIIACLSESESRVRYQATEALFNVVKIARAGALDHFPAVFNALARLVADPEPQVKQGAELLDRLVKDIVTESSWVELSQLVPLVRERVYARSGGVRQFVVSWLAVLDAVPDVDLVPHLPDLLDGLFHMLDDPNPEIRRMCDVQLNEFLRSIKKDPSRVDFQAMINILIIHAQSAEELLQLTAITWIKEFVELAGAGMLPHASGVLLAVLPCLAYCDEPRKSIRETAATVNLQLTNLIAYETESSPPRDVTGSQEEGAEDKTEATESQERTVGDERGDEKPGEQAGLQLDAVVGVVTQMVHHSSVHTRAAALEWLVRLYTRLPARMAAHSERVLAAALPSLADGADGVVRRALAVVAEICSCRDHAHAGEPEPSGYFQQFLQALLRLLATRAGLLEDRGAFVVRQLCVLLSAEHVYRALAAILLRERDLDFVATMVDVLNTILLTSAELYDLRLQLRNFNTPATCSLFSALYACWCHSPVSLLALCLLTHNYQHCNTLINTFGDLEITVDFLTEVDKLVQLIESPIFAYLRLELLDPEVAPPLRNALFGVLMLLPQSDAFHTLRKRLHCAPPHHNTQTSGSGSSSSKHGQHSGSSVDFSALLQQFRDAQAAQRDFRRRERARLAREEHDND